VAFRPTWRGGDTAPPGAEGPADTRQTRYRAAGAWQTAGAEQQEATRRRGRPTPRSRQRVGARRRPCTPQAARRCGRPTSRSRQRVGARRRPCTPQAARRRLRSLAMWHPEMVQPTLQAVAICRRRSPSGRTQPTGSLLRRSSLYPVPKRRPVFPDRASSRPRLAATPLPAPFLRLRPYTWSEDFHLASHVQCPAHTTELSDHGQRRDGLAFIRDVPGCSWFAPVIC